MPDGLQLRGSSRHGVAFAMPHAVTTSKMSTIWEMDEAESSEVLLG